MELKSVLRKLNKEEIITLEAIKLDELIKCMLEASLANLHKQFFSHKME